MVSYGPSVGSMLSNGGANGLMFGAKLPEGPADGTDDFERAPLRDGTITHGLA